MRYVGGKSRIAKEIAVVIAERKGDRAVYIEPFLGGGASFQHNAPMFGIAFAGDLSPDLVLLWQAVLDGWVPPESLTEDEYRALRYAEPSALRAFAGFGCLFGGKWFGGYGRSSKGISAAESSRSLLRAAKMLAGTPCLIRNVGYEHWDLAATAGAVIYLDPPYASTQGYGATGAFDSAAMWATARRWSGRGALVLVSELTAPDGWSSVWSKAHHQQLVGGTKQAERRVAIEQLWIAS